MKKEKIILTGFIGGIVITILVLAGYFLFYRPIFAGISNLPLTASGTPIFGTRTGTSTPVGQGFFSTRATNGTTSKAFEIGNSIDSVTFNIRVVTASATPNGLFDWAILGSNDFHCDTASTSPGILNNVIDREIYWTDADPSNSRTTGTITTALTNATGTSVTLTNLNWRCLRFQGNGSSTSVYVTAVTKDSF